MCRGTGSLHGSIEPCVLENVSVSVLPQAKHVSQEVMGTVFFIPTNHDEFSRLQQTRRVSALPLFNKRRYELVNR